MAPHEVQRFLPVGVDCEDHSVVPDLDGDGDPAEFFRGQLDLDPSLSAVPDGGDKLVGDGAGIGRRCRRRREDRLPDLASGKRICGMQCRQGTFQFRDPLSFGAGDDGGSQVPCRWRGRRGGDRR